MANLVADTVVKRILRHELGLVGAERYARRIGQVAGGMYSTQYLRIADQLREDKREDHELA